MPDNHLDLIRRRAARVAGHGKFVTIDHAKLPAYAAALPLDLVTAPKLSPDHHFTGDPEQTCVFVLTLDAINFGSGYFPYLQKLPGLSGYFTVATRLTELFRKSGPMTATELSEIPPARCSQIFQQPRDAGVVDELMRLFARAWNDLGRFVQLQCMGDFTRLVAAAQQSCAGLVDILSRIEFFRDVQNYNGLDVPFYKRAQLTAADLSLAIPGHPLGTFHDLNQLTIFADNLVPHVLRVDGVLKYADALAAKIDNNELVPRGSMEEIEIRAAAVHASELIVAELHQRGRPVSAMQLDYLLWNCGQQPAYKSRPRHRTRTVYY
ncbi:MAG: queuosine salvage family protein [Tepidisphaeraceae bacterium]